MSLINIERYVHLMHEPFYQKLGKVSKIVGLTIESIGPDAKLMIYAKYIRLIKARRCLQKLLDSKIRESFLCHLKMLTE